MANLQVKLLFNIHHKLSQHTYLKEGVVTYHIQYRAKTIIVTHFKLEGNHFVLQQGQNRRTTNIP